MATTEAAAPGSTNWNVPLVPVQSVPVMHVVVKPSEKQRSKALPELVTQILSAASQSIPLELTVFVLIPAIPAGAT